MCYFVFIFSFFFFFLYFYFLFVFHFIILFHAQVLQGHRVSLVMPQGLMPICRTLLFCEDSADVTIFAAASSWAVSSWMPLIQQLPFANVAVAKNCQAKTQLLWQRLKTQGKEEEGGKDREIFFLIYT
jgi:hypothetical protein